MMDLRRWLAEKLFRRGKPEDVQRRKMLRRVEKLRGRVAKRKRVEEVAAIAGARSRRPAGDAIGHTRGRRLAMTSEDIRWIMRIACGIVLGMLMLQGVLESMRMLIFMVGGGG